MILLAAALVQAAAVPLSPAAPCPGICDPQRLKPYFDKLARIRTEGRTVRILQIGDSHTAGDQITGAWRAALQARYGDAGRGVLAPGRPYAGYLTKGVTANQGPGWSTSGIFGPTYRSADATPRGIANFSATGVAGATMTLSADRGGFTSFTACALAGPGAGTLILTLGTATKPVAFDRPQLQPSCATVYSVAPASLAALTVAGGPVTVTSWSTERADPGVILSNVGTVGAQFVHFGRTDDTVVDREGAEYRPDLLVIAFGTNEAFMPGFTAREYEARLRAGIRRLRSQFGDVPMLLLGAPDSATTNAALQVGEGGASPACGIELSGDGTVRDWRPTAALPVVQATQRRVAHEAGAAFWDWSAAMGGRCTASTWVRAAMMRPDHVHFSTVGATEIAKRLQADLDAAAAVVGAGQGAW